MILLEGLTKTFNNGRGIFDLSFEVKKGEIFGFLGPNGAGKSTTIRHLMGFMKANRGKAFINGMDCWENSASIKRDLGYLPGEIAFPDGMNGKQFLHLLAGMRGMKDNRYQNQLIERLQFDVNTPIRKMSKGMKQKVGIVAAFMHEPSILILDEPTSGLDPLMQSIFIEIVQEAKLQGKTIMMSSHSFDEINRTCSRAGIIKDGKLIAVEDINKLQMMQRKILDITFDSINDIETIRLSGLTIMKEEGLRIQIVLQGDYDRFIQCLAKCRVNNIDINVQTLEEKFMQYYDKEEVAN